MPTDKKVSISDKTAIDGGKSAKAPDFAAVPLLDEHEERKQRALLPVQSISGASSAHYAQLETAGFCFQNQGRMATFLSVINPDKAKSSIRVLALSEQDDLKVAIEPGKPQDIGPFAVDRFNRTDQLVYVDIIGGPLLIAVKRLGI